MFRQAPWLVNEVMSEETQLTCRSVLADPSVVGSGAYARYALSKFAVRGLTKSAGPLRLLHILYCRRSRVLAQLLSWANTVFASTHTYLGLLKRVTVRFIRPVVIPALDNSTVDTFDETYTIREGKAKGDLLGEVVTWHGFHFAIGTRFV